MEEIKNSFTIQWRPILNGAFPHAQINELGILTSVKDISITHKEITLSTADGSTIDHELAFTLGSLVHSFRKH